GGLHGWSSSSSAPPDPTPLTLSCPTPRYPRSLQCLLQSTRSAIALCGDRACPSAHCLQCGASLSPSPHLFCRPYSFGHSYTK
ncbi:Leucyl/phenylalanyl-tRNA--protein transferase, partial [Frankliniella fusca]